MLRNKVLFALAFLSPWTVSMVSGRASADVQAVLACRQLSPGPGRAECLERESATLERSERAPVKAVVSPPPTATGRDGRILSGVSTITYRDGRPVFRLANGQTWYSTDRRHLTFKPGRSHVVIERTSVGMLLHYDGSFFGLQVVR